MSCLSVEVSIASRAESRSRLLSGTGGGRQNSRLKQAKKPPSRSERFALIMRPLHQCVSRRIDTFNAMSRKAAFNPASLEARYAWDVLVAH